MLGPDLLLSNQAKPESLGLLGLLEGLFDFTEILE